MSPPIQLSLEQEDALLAINTCFADSSFREFRLGGYAGTGKTTLMREALSMLSPRFKRISVVAPTGKASLALRKKGVPASTIHSFCYEMISEKPLKFALRFLPPSSDLIICDEASMVDKEIYEDLTSFKIPILWVGDPGQLQPVRKDAKLMHKPDLVLSTIFRQAADNPIISLATRIREGKPIPCPTDIPNLCINYRRAFSGLKFSDFDQIICGRNKTRHSLNDQIRAKLGLTTKLPLKGEKLIILRNNLRRGLVNGQIVHVHSAVRNGVYDLIEDEGFIHESCHIHRDIFDRLDQPNPVPPDIIWADFGYAITCHKSQGSEWPRLLVIDEAFGLDARRWRYTAVTRASEHLTYLL